MQIIRIQRTPLNMSDGKWKEKQKTNWVLETPNHNMCCTGNYTAVREDGKLLSDVAKNKRKVTKDWKLSRNSSWHK